MDSIIAWIVSLMISVIPVGAQETPEQTQARYESIARDLVSVVYDEHEKPLFPGDQARAKTAALLIAIAKFESEFRRDVDLGEVRGDSGKSWCLGQINLGRPTKQGETPMRIYTDGHGRWVWAHLKSAYGYGYTGQDLVKDRRKCFQAMLWIARTSFEVCRPVHRKNQDRLLSLYVSRSCLLGGEASAKRMRLARKWGSPPGTKVLDTEVLAELKTQANAAPPRTTVVH